MSSFADRAVLSASQLDAIRHLELWAQANTGESETTGATDDDDDADVAYSLDPNAAPPLDPENPQLVRHRKADAPPGSVAPVRTMGDLEAFVLRIDAITRKDLYELDHAELRRLKGMHDCCVRVATGADELRRRLDEKARECALMRGTTSEMLAEVGTQMRNLREQAAINEALHAQLAPLEEAKAVGATLDRLAWRDDTPHSPAHPLVQALATLDKSARHLQAHAHWTNSAVHLAQVNALRARALRLAAALVTRPLDALTLAATAQLAQLAQPAQPAAAGKSTAIAADIGGSAGAGAGAGATAAPPSSATVDGLGSAAAPIATSESAAAAREALETETLYLRFRELALRVRPWVVELEGAHKGAPSGSELGAVLRETRQEYWRHRRTGVGPCLRAALERIAQEEGEQDVAAQTRACCNHVLRVCRNEHALFHAFFATSEEGDEGGGGGGLGVERSAGDGVGGAASEKVSSDGVSAGAGSAEDEAAVLAAEIEALCYALYDHMRPLLLRQRETSLLCEVVLVCRTEVLPTISDGGAPCRPLYPIVERLLQDAQERLTFRVQTFIRDEIRAFRPSPADLEWPRVAVGAPMQPSAAEPPTTPMGATSAAATSATAATAATGATPATALPPRSAEEPPASADETRGSSMEDGWYVTVARALSCLALLYRCVPRSVFEGLAQEILSECAASVERAAMQVRAKHRDSSRLHGTLFSIAQLLVLREQIAPFDTAFAVTDRGLDFSQTRAMMRTIVERRGRLGGLGGVVELLQQGTPSLVKSQRDAKVALDRELRAACEEFIRHCTDAVAKPITSLVHTLAPPAAADGAMPKSPGGPSASAMPNDPAIEAAMTQAEQGLEAGLRPAYALMAAYLPEPSTRAILFAPIRAAIIDALGQLQTILNAFELTAPKGLSLKPERLSRLAAAVDALGGAPAARK
jgi:hypothetical protein